MLPQQASVFARNISTNCSGALCLRHFSKCMRRIICVPLLPLATAVQRSSQAEEDFDLAATFGRMRGLRLLAARHADITAPTKARPTPRNRGAGTALASQEFAVNLRIPRRHGHFAFGVIQSGLTCLVAAAIASYPDSGAARFIEHWLVSWLISWLAMLPVVLLAAPLIRALVNHLTRD